MIRFHNRVLDTLPGSVPTAQRFATARELVTKHYQWMIRTDYLPRICRPSAVDNVFNNGRKVFEVGATPTDVPTMPIEFSRRRLPARALDGARQLQLEQDLRRRAPGASTCCSRSRPPAATSAAARTLPSNWIADFRRLYDFGEAGKANLDVRRRASSTARRRSTRASSTRCATCPPSTFGGSGIPSGDPRRNLAFRNLTRARMVRLATGQQMATFMRTQGRQRHRGSRRRRSATARAASRSTR